MMHDKKRPEKAEVNPVESKEPEATVSEGQNVQKEEEPADGSKTVFALIYRDASQTWTCASGKYGHIFTPRARRPFRDP
jgi:hypothetical protein